MAKDKRKPIVELDKPGGKVIKYWKSSKDAALFYDINAVNISQNVTGQTLQAKGHYFRHASLTEIANYNKINAELTESTIVQPTLIEPIPNESHGPAPTLVDTSYDAVNQEDTMSHFELLLEKSKKNFQKNKK